MGPVGDLCILGLAEENLLAGDRYPLTALLE